MLLLQHLQYPDMGDAARATSRQDEADTRPMGGRRGGRKSGVRDLLREGDGRSGEPECRANDAEYPETGPDRPW